MMEFLTPGRFADALLKAERLWPRLLRGAAIFVACIAATVFSSAYMIYNKIEVKFALAGFETAPLPIPSMGEIIFSRIIYLLIALVIMFVGLRVLVFFTGKEGRSKALLTLVLHSFMIFLAITLVSMPVVAQSPKLPFLVVDMTLLNVTFHDASITGLYENGSLTLTSNWVNARYVSAYKAFPGNYSKPQWSAMAGDEDVERALSETVTVVNMTEVRWVEEGEEKAVNRLDIVEGNWSKVTYQDVLSRGFVRYGMAPSGPLEMMYATLTPVAWALVILYNAVGFRKLYEASMPLTIAAWILIFFVLFIAGLA